MRVPSTKFTRVCLILVLWRLVEEVRCFIIRISNALEIKDPVDRRGVEIHRRMGLRWLAVVPIGCTIMVGDETIEYTMELMTKLMLDVGSS
ncbi:hypothetical protein Tco_0979490 [Tanacetum coccineum]